MSSRNVSLARESRAYFTENADQKLDDELGRPRERGRRVLPFIKDDFKEKLILLKGAPRGMSIKENMPM